MSIWVIYSSAASIALALTLLATAISKWRNRVTFEVVLTRLLPRAVWEVPIFDSRRLARLVCVVEVLIATSLLAADGTATQIAAAGAVVLSGTFVAATITAMRRGTSCGCAGKATGSAGRADVARAFCIAAVAITLMVSRLQEQTAVWRDGGAQLILSLIIGLVMSDVLLTWLYGSPLLRRTLAGRRLPAPGPSLIEGGESGSSTAEVDTSGEPSGAPLPARGSMSRRGFIIRVGMLVGAGAAALAGVPLLGNVTQVLAIESCFPQREACDNCCLEKEPYDPMCNECCDNCFNQCVDGTPCPPNQAMCNGCLPNLENC